jgi:hypothetical protein
MLYFVNGLRRGWFLMAGTAALGAEVGRAPVPELAGLHETTQILGTSKKRAMELVKQDEFPTPVQVLAMGPVWEADRVREFAATRDTSPGRRPTTRGKAGPFYAEVMWHPADGGLAQFRSWLGTATDHDDAEDQAVEDTRRAHPDATGFQVYTSRRLTEDRAARIREKILAGTWDGL